MRLNLGCGNDIRADWINIDAHARPGVDVVADLDECKRRPLPFDDGSADELLLSHVLEHIRDSLGLMTELWRVAKPDALLTIRCPYGSSDDAWSDPTHVRPYFLQSFEAFAQPYYFRADYGYRGDWRIENFTLLVDKSQLVKTPNQLLYTVHTERNVVAEMIVAMRKVSPLRLAVKEPSPQPNITFLAVNR